jgi:hypothetical protein
MALRPGHKTPAKLTPSGKYALVTRPAHLHHAVESAAFSALA